MASDSPHQPVLEDGITFLLSSLNISAKSVEITTEVTKRDGFIGQIQCAYVDGINQSDENVKLNLVGKSAPVTSPIFAPELKTKFEREIYIYEKVLPAFRKLQEEKNVDELFQAYPKYYLCSEDLVVLENMKESGFKMYDKQLNYNHISLILKEVGKLHALSFVLREKNKELFDELCRNIPNFEFSEIYREKCEPVYMNWYNNALNSLNKDSFIQKQFNKLKDKFYEYNKTIASASHDQKYAVIGHCDCSPANILFKYTDGTLDDSPSELSLLDWQLSTKCSPAIDVSQILYCCADPSIRKHYYNDLLKVYYKSVSSFLLQFGLNPEEIFPYRALQEHLAMYSVFGLCRAIVTIQLSALLNLPDLHDNLKRNVDPVQLFNKMKTNKDAIEVVKELILDHFHYGYDI